MTSTVEMEAVKVEASVKPPKPVLRVLTVHLAPDEWGNEKMKEVAMEEIRAHGGENMVVEVIEHAGWYLSFRFDGKVVGTANEMGRLDPEVLAWAETFGARVYLREVWRGKR